MRSSSYVAQDDGYRAQPATGGGAAQQRLQQAKKVTFASPRASSSTHPNSSPAPARPRDSGSLAFDPGNCLARLHHWFVTTFCCGGVSGSGRKMVLEEGGQVPGEGMEIQPPGSGHRSGSSTSTSAAPKKPCRIVIQNDSKYPFVYDGEYFFSGAGTELGVADARAGNAGGGSASTSATSSLRTSSSTSTSSSAQNLLSGEQSGGGTSSSTNIALTPTDRVIQANGDVRKLLFAKSSTSLSGAAAVAYKQTLPASGIVWLVDGSTYSTYLAISLHGPTVWIGNSVPYDLLSASGSTKLDKKKQRGMKVLTADGHGSYEVTADGSTLFVNIYESLVCADEAAATPSAAAGGRGASAVPADGVEDAPATANGTSSSTGQGNEPNSNYPLTDANHRPDGLNYGPGFAQLSLARPPKKQRVRIARVFNPNKKVAEEQAAAQLSPEQEALKKYDYTVQVLDPTSCTTSTSEGGPVIQQGQAQAQGEREASTRAATGSSASLSGATAPRAARRRSRSSTPKPPSPKQPLLLLVMDGTLYFADSSTSNPLVDEHGSLIAVKDVSFAKASTVSPGVAREDEFGVPLETGSLGSTSADFDSEIAEIEITDEDAETVAAVEEFWAKTRPKDGWTGIKQGLGSAVGGVLGGVAALGAATVGGVRDAKPGAGNKMLGFVKGLGVGVMAGVAVPVAGVVGGATQIVRGIKAEATGFQAKRENKIWDPDTGTWVNVNLKLMEKNVNLDLDGGNKQAGGTAAGTSTASASGKVGANGKQLTSDVYDTEYYDLLGVSPDADTAAIKKAYYKIARSCHPDKNPDDEHAKAKFQSLSDAYSVLSSPPLREKYDKNGKDGVKEAEIPKIEPTVFFALLFGSEKFEGYTGDMSIATMAESMFKSFEDQATGKDGKKSGGTKGGRRKSSVGAGGGRSGQPLKALPAPEINADAAAPAPGPVGVSTSTAPNSQPKKKSGFFSGLTSSSRNKPATNNGTAVSTSSSATPATGGTTSTSPPQLISTASGAAQASTIAEEGASEEDHRMIEGGSSEEGDVVDLDPFAVVGDAKFKRQQWKRQVQCAVFLKKRLELYTKYRNEQAFRQDVLQEANEHLVTASFGKELLAVLGELYQLRASVFLADELKGRFTLDALSASGKSFGKKWANRVSILGSGYAALKQAKRAEKQMKKLEKVEEDETKTEEEKHKLKAEAQSSMEDQTLPALLQLAWAIVVKDLEDTVKIVVKFLLKDVSVPWVERIKRAKGLVILGELFSRVAAEADGTEFVGLGLHTRADDDDVGGEGEEAERGERSESGDHHGQSNRGGNGATAGTSGAGPQKSASQASAAGGREGSKPPSKERAGDRSPAGRGERGSPTGKPSARELFETAMIGTVTKEKL